LANSDKKHPPPHQSEEMRNLLRITSGLSCTTAGKTKKPNAHSSEQVHGDATVPHGGRMKSAINSEDYSGFL